MRVEQAVPIVMLSGLTTQRPLRIMTSEASRPALHEQRDNDARHVAGCHPRRVSACATEILPTGMLGNRWFPVAARGQGAPRCPAHVPQSAGLLAALHHAAIRRIAIQLHAPGRRALHGGLRMTRFTDTFAVYPTPPCSHSASLVYYPTRR